MCVGVVVVVVGQQPGFIGMNGWRQLSGCQRILTIQEALLDS